MHRTKEELEAGLETVREAPRGVGRIELIVRRPAIDEREVVESAEITVEKGLVGDNWHEKPSSTSPDGGPHPEAQITVMNSRAAALVAGTHDRWPLAGDQLFVDMAIGDADLPPGTRLGINDVVLEVTPKPHTGCHKFSARFGVEALRLVNSPVGRELNLRGINTRVVRGGTIHLGDEVSATKLS